MEITEKTVSIIWGRSSNYVPGSTVPFNWDGTMTVENGKASHLDHLHYKFTQWCQAMEVQEPIYDKDWALPSRRRGSYLSWRSDTEPGSAGTLEGLRLTVAGDENTVIRIVFKCTGIAFSLGSLMKKERLTFHVGEQYSGCPIEVFLGHDARARVSKATFSRLLAEDGKDGFMLEPDDFAGGKCVTFHSLYGLELLPGASSEAALPETLARKSGDCPVRLQITQNLGYTGAFTEDRVTLTVTVGKVTKTVSHVFTNRLFLPKMDDIYVYLPWEEMNGAVRIGFEDGHYPLVIHRVCFGADVPSLADELRGLPPLPAVRRFHTGAENDLLTHENGEVDFFLDVLKEQEIGDFVMIRERNAIAPDDVITRWANKIKAYGFLCTTSGGPERTVTLLKSLLGDAYYGEHGHEISNLIYGWGDAEPVENRIGRTVPACMQSYLKRMSAYKIIGQAIPMQFLDYESGADVVMSEIPGAHATLVLCGARGAAKAYGKTLWGVHIANHVTRAPLDECHVRRLEIVLYQSWLFGAGIAYDEEVAFKYNHDTLYSYSDAIPTAYRRIYQMMFHYANSIALGEPIVENGFLIGNGDVLTGGASSGPYTEPPKFWGQFGPETRAWEYDTPESGWKLADVFLPGVWLYPVKQEKEKIRLFFSGTPHGQVDLIPAFAKADVLSKYQLLVLPGWNTMTPEICDNLIAYAKQGGSLLLCAAQCSEHTERDFLLEKRDFKLYNGGDLSALAGVVIGQVSGTVRTAVFDGRTFDFGGGVPGVEVTLKGAEVLAYADDGRPILVRNRIGRGSVTMLTVGEYWGSPALEAFGREVLASAIRRKRSAVTIGGDVSDVDFHRFTYPGGERVVLVNTDWSEEENVKDVTVRYGGFAVKTRVKQGKMRHILFQDGLSVGFDVPSALVDDLNVDGNRIKMTVSGCGKTAFSVDSSKIMRDISVDGAAWSFENGTLTVDFGSTWRKCDLTAAFAD